MPAPSSSSASTTRDLGQKVAEHLAADLFAGRWKAGDLLPKETDLCERFGVSRPSVRSGMQILTSLGIVRRISGHGTVVSEFQEWTMLDPLVTRWMVQYSGPNPQLVAEIFEFRHATEPFISAIAARRATARDLLAIEEAFLGMERTVQSGVSDVPDSHGLTFSDYDVDFHAAIYRATHNMVWSQLSHILHPAILLVVRTSNTTAEELLDSLERHRRLMDCIRLRQPEEAFEAALHVMARTAYDLDLEDTGAADDPLLARWKSIVLGAGHGPGPKRPDPPSPARSPKKPEKP